MIEIILLGLNHNTAPVALRERLAFTKEEAEESLRKLNKDPSINELLIFSTCNRVEILFTSKNRKKAITTIKNYISEFKKIESEKYEKALYVYSNEQAVRHMPEMPSKHINT